MDKGGLDALMEPKLGSELGNLYLSEVLDQMLQLNLNFYCIIDHGKKIKVDYACIDLFNTRYKGF